MQLLAHGPSYLATSCKYHQASRPPPCQNSCTWTVGSLTYCIEQSDWDFSEKNSNLSLDKLCICSLCEEGIYVYSIVLFQGKAPPLPARALVSGNGLWLIFIRCVKKKYIYTVT